MKVKSLNPATEKVMKEFETINYNDCIRELKKVRKAWLDCWKDVLIPERAKYLKKLSTLLKKRKRKYGLFITKEMGKPIAQSISEIEKCAWLCEYYSKNASTFLKDEIVRTEARKSYVTFEPLGIILGIMPWNFPFWQVFRCAVPALAAGNAFALKHSSNVPQCAMAIQEVFEDAGLKNIFKTLLTDSQTASQLIQSELISAVSVTGSVGAGSKVAEAAGKAIKKSVLELGGSDPFIVLEDADLERASEKGVQSRMANAGQSCIAAKRFIVVKSVAKQFEKKFVEHAKKLKIGNPVDKKTDNGPLARKDLVMNLDRQVKESVKQGAKLLYGGYRPKMKGYYYMPTVLTDVSKKMTICREETFGPVATIIVVRNAEEAIKEANSTSFGLAATIWSKNIKRAEQLASKIEAGSVFINSVAHSDPRLPFGGIKNSGFGRELSHYGIREFVNIKTIVINQ